VLHHITLWVPDLRRAERSWSWLLGQLGYARDRSVGPVLLLRHATGSAIVLEQSADMVPGMLYSRMRPGLNHIAFQVDSASSLARLREEAGEYGWSSLPADRHPIAGGAEVAYLEDGDGFEVELVAPSREGPSSASI
jgi:catechol 2,3-dioxygenase-like lactoylglutathione lyase family enzyme